MWNSCETSPFARNLFSDHNTIKLKINNKIIEFHALYNVNHTSKQLKEEIIMDIMVTEGWRKQDLKTLYLKIRDE